MKISEIVRHGKTIAAAARRGMAVAWVPLALSGCEGLTVPDYNNPSIEDLQSNPTQTAVVTATTGLLEGARQNIASPNAYISLLGILGRESYNFDNAEPRFITEVLIGPLTPGGAFGGNLWTLRYRNIRNANIVLNAVDQVPGFTEAQANGIRGFAKTIQALDYLLVINTRHVNGAVIETNRPLSDGPGEIRPRAEVLAHIAGLLDEAQAHLQAAGGAFAFPLSSGFSGFATPASFAEFNRALKARVQVYREDYSQALQALDASFLDPAAPLELGAYYDFSAGSGDTPNSLSSATIRAHPSVVADAQLRANGDLDRRVAEKVVEITPRTQLGLSSDLGFTLYPGPDSPVPIITNEELILLRAEARWFTGDPVGATADLNLIRSEAGGLDPISIPTSDEGFVEALLRERRYSLLFEGHRWIDVRRFDRLDLLPLDLATHTRQAEFPIPEAECLARGESEDCGVG
jgi:hypothetical protein